MSNIYEKGKVSVVMVTYNRGHLIKKSIESLLNQTYKNIEIILVDNGSTDNTPEVLQEYKTPEYQDIIRIFRLEQNRRFAGGGNFAFEQIRGEWFTLLDDDDLAMPDAFEKMLAIPNKLDPKINAVTSNCLNSATGKLAGMGLTTSQYLSFGDLVRHCHGEFWGITKSELLLDARFNEKLLGYEDTFWYQISRRANRYYLHEPLRIWTTDHGPTITQLASQKNRKSKVQSYRILVNEDIYWDSLSEHLPGKFRSKCLKGLLYAYMDDDNELAKKYLKKLTKQSKIGTLLGKASMMVPSSVMRTIFQIIP